MIVYSSTKKDFSKDVMTNQIEKTILTSFVREMGHSTGKSEVASWRNSMVYMNNIISDAEIPDDAGVAIEYKIPQSSKRIDFILTGTNDVGKKIAILIEIKQWSDGVEITKKDGIVHTNFFGEVNHPSYQAWSYATLLEDYNSNVQDGNVTLKPCAYLHNYDRIQVDRDPVLESDFYKTYTDKAPIFLRADSLKLQAFIKKFVKHGDKGELIYEIENGKIRPSKSLADSLSSLLQGNQEFVLIDSQKLVYETALQLAEEASETNKKVFIVEGGPGTGKSVVAVNLLAELTKRRNVTQYVTRNSAPREVYQVKLTGTFSKTRIANLFTSSGSFHDIGPNTFDSLIVDEAQRLNAKSGLFNHLGENQIKELISAAKCTVFFIDEDQRVTLKDIGEVAEIENWAKELGVTIFRDKLESQFRCNGSDGYLAWVENTLQIRQTANESLDDIDYDFQVMESPKEVHEAIIERNKVNNKARVLAGYCWKWISKKNPTLKDIVIGDYEATWNLDEQGQSWIVHPDSVSEVGCIHTSQGLELEYVGVIIGPDLIVRDGKIITDASKRATTDKSVSGYKKLLKEHPEEAKRKADMIIKNTYRTLMTRAMKGCFVYCTDPETQEYFKKQASSPKEVIYGDIPTGVTINVEKEA